MRLQSFTIYEKSIVKAKLLQVYCVKNDSFAKANIDLTTLLTFNNIDC